MSAFDAVDGPHPRGEGGPVPPFGPHLPQLGLSVQTDAMIDLLEALKTLLWEEWDPIGVRGTDCPNDEYNGYAFEVWTMLKRNASVGDIEEYLSSMETGHIGLSNISGRAGVVAKKAIALKLKVDP